LAVPVPFGYSKNACKTNELRTFGLSPALLAKAQTANLDENCHASALQETNW